MFSRILPEVCETQQGSLMVKNGRTITDDQLRGILRGLEKPVKVCILLNTVCSPFKGVQQRTFLDVGRKN
jgi:hypothetical protein